MCIYCISHVVFLSLYVSLSLCLYREFFLSLMQYFLILDRKLETLGKLTLLEVIAFNLDKCEEIRTRSAKRHFCRALLISTKPNVTRISH